jgi:DNA-binding PadR family transcriptional regulator
VAGLSSNRSRGHGSRRGLLPIAILAALQDESMNGYQVIKKITEDSAGLWRPSPGSVYPALADLQRQGLAVVATADRERRFQITEAGRQLLANRHERLTNLRASLARDAEQSQPMREAVDQLLEALEVVVRQGTPAQRIQAIEVLTRGRREIYTILGSED